MISSISTNGFASTSPAIMSVFEHQRLQITNFSHRTDFEWLLAQEFDMFSIHRQGGHWQLKVGHYIGIIVLPSGMTLEILPKTIVSDSNQSSQAAIAHTRHWVQNMLADLLNTAIHTNAKGVHYKNIGQFSPHLAPLSQTSTPISAWLVSQFLQLLAIYQPSQQYQVQITNQPRLHGKLLIKQQLRQNSMQPHKFVSETSTLSPDTLANRLIKSALDLLKPLGYTPLLAWRQTQAFSPYELRQLDSLYVTALQQLNSHTLKPQFLAAGKQLVLWAYWLLHWQQNPVQTGNGLQSTNVPISTPIQPRLCLLMNMNQAFEQWASRKIGNFLQQVNSNYQPEYQTQQVWLRDQTGQCCLSIRPDLVMYRHSKPSTSHPSSHPSSHLSVQMCSHVIDIKWKYLSQPSAISASDAYQLTSYAQAYQAEQVWLVYPVIDSTVQPIALKQHTSKATTLATLWLMPFNVHTGTLNTHLPDTAKPSSISR